MLKDTPHIEQAQFSLRQFGTNYQWFDEFSPQFQFSRSNQKFVYFQRFDEFFPYHQFQFFP